MEVVLSKTDYLLFRECAKNIWYKFHMPEIYQEKELSDFEKAIIETGNQVELIARQLFPTGVLIEGRGVESQKKTQDLLSKKEEVLFQPILIYPVRNSEGSQHEFSNGIKNGFLAAVDVLEFIPERGEYNIYEIKSTNSVDKKTHYHDLAFQVNLLEMCGLKIAKASIIHLNPDYIREGDININKLFQVTDTTEIIENIKEEVAEEMQIALKYLSQEAEPVGYCSCIYKGRSSHCSTFKHANSKVPDYGVHDIVRIGNNKSKLQDLVDVGIFKLEDVAEDKMNDFSLPQKNQIETYKNNFVIVDKSNIKKELENLVFPLYFIDYETFPSAIPMFEGFSPYQQIPFQYAGFVLDSFDEGPKHFGFICSEYKDPTKDFADSLKDHLGKTGSIIVWSKQFECGRNKEIAKRLPEFKEFMDDINERTYDLMDIFSKQYYVHKNFFGRTSIKKIMPVLVPDLSYKVLNIQEGGTASQKWNEAVSVNIPKSEKEKIIEDLKEYCKLDAFAMYKIWKYLLETVS